MYLITHDKAECCGCRACLEACPKSCITMVADEETFLYPQIDVSLCIGCHKCETVCPVTKPPVNSIKSACIGIHTNEEVVFRSASGGAFSAIAEPLLTGGYIIFGAKYEEHLAVVHDSATTPEEFAAFRKSKYVLSNTNGSFVKIEALLSQNKKVLFSGTPCQISALKAFLGSENKNLVCVDIVCHGAPSQMIFDEEIRYLSDKEHSPVIAYEFRAKHKANSRMAFVTFASGKTMLLTEITDPYLKGYYSRLFYRPSCGQCPFATSMRNSDITLADAWGIEKIYSDLNALSGVSMMLANTDKGKEIIAKISDLMNIRQVNIDWAIQANEQLHKPTDFHPKRALFFDLLEAKGYQYAVNKCMRPTLKVRIRHMIAMALPSKLRTKIKRVVNKEDN